MIILTEKAHSDIFKTYVLMTVSSATCAVGSLLGIKIQKTITIILSLFVMICSHLYYRIFKPFIPGNTREAIITFRCRLVGLLLFSLSFGNFLGSINVKYFLEQKNLVVVPLVGMHAIFALQTVATFIFRTEESIALSFMTITAIFGTFIVEYLSNYLTFGFRKIYVMCVYLCVFIMLMFHTIRTLFDMAGKRDCDIISLASDLTCICVDLYLTAIKIYSDDEKCGHYKCKK